MEDKPNNYQRAVLKETWKAGIRNTSSHIYILQADPLLRRRLVSVTSWQYMTQAV